MAADLGVCHAILKEIERPILGVCLGHQALGWVHGARIVQAPRQLHGRRSQVRHDGRGIFAGLPQDFWAVRYHSLAVTGPIPAPLEASAWSDDGVIMALRDTSAERFGVQFHPESICTEHGDALTQNFLKIAGHTTVSFPCPPPERRSSTKSAWRIEARALEQGIDCERTFTQLIAGRHGAFWLDSSSSVGRFSFLGAADGPLGHLVTWKTGQRPRSRRPRCPPIECGKDLLDVLREHLRDTQCDADLPFDFVGGWVGWMGYEARSLFGQQVAQHGDLPDAAFAFCDRLIVADHHTGRTWLVAIVAEDSPDAAHSWFSSTSAALQQLLVPAPAQCTTDGDFEPDKSPHQYMDAVREAKRHIRAGETYEVCLTHQLRGPPLDKPLDAYRNLRRANPAPYSAYLAFDGVKVLCSSPEQFLKLDRVGTLSTRPIKGTAARNADPTLDQLSAQRLRDSLKDRAENLMIVDLMRNDLGRVCQRNSVAVPSLMAVQTLATVHHLVSTVTGALRTDRDALHAVAAAFPPGSMTGAPKERTMQIIEELERAPREIYSGTIGFFSVNGTCDMNVVIRTAVSTAQRTTIGTGGAVTGLSDPEQEWHEAKLKAQRLLTVLEGVDSHPQHVALDEHTR